MKSELINIRRVWDKEKNPSSRQELNPWPPEHWAGPLSIELQDLKIHHLITSHNDFDSADPSSMQDDFLLFAIVQNKMITKSFDNLFITSILKSMVILAI